MTLCPGSLRADGPCKHGEFDVHYVDERAFQELDRETLESLYMLSLETISELEGVVLDYFTNERDGWKRGWLPWRDRAAKLVGIPTSEELREVKVLEGST